MSERKPAMHVSTDSAVTPSGQHGELALYTTAAGSAHVYLSQIELTELFETSVPDIDMKHLLAEGELQDEATIKNHLIVRTEGARQHTHNFMAFSEGPLLKGAEKISHDRMQQAAHEHYAEFDAKRLGAEALQADVEDIKELETVENTCKGRRQKQ
jgi:hypothetical protein